MLTVLSLALLAACSRSSEPALTRQGAIDALTELTNRAAAPAPTVPAGTGDSALVGGAGGTGGLAGLADGGVGLGPMTADQAGCVTDRLIARYGLPGLSQRLRAEPLDGDFAEAVLDDQFRCGVGGDPRQQIVDLLTGSGVTGTAAPCVADRLLADLTDADISVILSGDDNPSFNQKFDTAMRSCGAAS